MFVVEELDDLFGYCALDVAAPVGGDDEDVGLLNVEEAVAGEEGDSLCREAEFFHETAGIARRRREVDDVDHVVFSFHEACSVWEQKVARSPGMVVWGPGGLLLGVDDASRFHGRGLRCGLDEVGAVAAPVVITGDDDGCLLVAEALDEFEG